MDNPNQLLTIAQVERIYKSMGQKVFSQDSRYLRVQCGVNEPALRSSPFNFPQRLPDHLNIARTVLLMVIGEASNVSMLRTACIVCLLSVPQLQAGRGGYGVRS